MEQDLKMPELYETLFSTMFRSVSHGLPSIEMSTSGKTYTYCQSGRKLLVFEARFSCLLQAGSKIIRVFDNDHQFFG